MKNLIITISIIIVLSTLIIYQADINLFIRNSKNLEVCAEDAAVALSNEIDPIHYGNGDIAFNNEYIANIFTLLDENVNMTYWKKGVHIKIDIVSDLSTDQITSIERRTDGTIRTNYLPSSLFPSSDNSINPRVKITLTGYNPIFELKFLQNENFSVTKSATAEYEGH
ncbi:MAG: hypothetical protein RR495_03835 [Anaerovoracaceae bacterium]